MTKNESFVTIVCAYAGECLAGVHIPFVHLHLTNASIWFRGIAITIVENRQNQRIVFRANIEIDLGFCKSNRKNSNNNHNSNHHIYIERKSILICIKICLLTATIQLLHYWMKCFFLVFCQYGWWLVIIVALLCAIVFFPAEFRINSLWTTIGLTFSRDFFSSCCSHKCWWLLTDQSMWSSTLGAF